MFKPNTAVLPQTYQCTYLNYKYWGTPAWTEHTRDRKYWKKHAEAFILQWSDNG